MATMGFGPYYNTYQASCGYQAGYGSPVIPVGTGGIYRSPIRSTANTFITSYDWNLEDEIDVQVKPEPKRNPNGYRQRKLKARLNQLKD